MFWLILYSQTNIENREITANAVISIHPSEWFLNCLHDYPDTETKLLFAIEISEKRFNDLNGRL